MNIFLENQFVLLVCCIWIVCCDGAVEWSYTGPHGPSTWSSSFPKCGGRRQSPVDIQSKETVFEDFEALKLNYDKNVALKMENNGHTVQLSTINSKVNLNISGGGLPSGTAFRVIQLNFHWGGNNSLGSEHKLDGRSFPLEMHVVHFNTKYSEYATALNKSDGLAVMSVLFQLGSKDNANLNVITEMLKNVSCEEMSLSLSSVALKSLLPSNTSSFYRYHGSLTTPGCEESVEWIIFKTPATISGTQLRSFRQIFRVNASAGVQKTKKTLLVNNFRPVQPLNQRSVRRNFDQPQLSCGRKDSMTATCSKLVSGRSVNYKVQLLRPCILPTEVSAGVAVPDEDFTWTKSFFHQGQYKAVHIANLNYSVDVEMHSHGNGGLHVTVSQRELFDKIPNHVDVISEVFPVDQTCSINCTIKDFEDCRRFIRSGDEKVEIGFAAELQDACGRSSCQVHVDLYRKESLSWVLTEVLIFNNGQIREANLRGIIVHHQKQHLIGAGSQPTVQTFKAEINLNDKNIDFKLYLVVSKGITYNLFYKTFQQPSSKNIHQGDGSGKHVVIDVAVALIVVAIIGGVAYLLYRKRHYFRARHLHLKMPSDTAGIPGPVEQMVYEDSITDKKPSGEACILGPVEQMVYEDSTTDNTIVYENSITDKKPWVWLVSQNRLNRWYMRTASRTIQLYT